MPPSKAGQDGGYLHGSRPVPSKSLPPASAASQACGTVDITVVWCRAVCPCSAKLEHNDDRGKGDVAARRVSKLRLAQAATARFAVRLEGRHAATPDQCPFHLLRAREGMFCRAINCIGDPVKIGNVWG